MENSKKKVTFMDFIRSCRKVEDVGAELRDDMLMGESGYIYLDGFYITDTKDGKFWTIVGRSDIIVDDLESAERWLWNEFVDGEINGEL